MAAPSNPGPSPVGDGPGLEIGPQHAPGPLRPIESADRSTAKEWVAPARLREAERADRPIGLAVDWFRVRHADWAQAYRDTYPHLNSCLQVSATWDGAVILLNPNVKSTEGEWQTYFFASWIPGAIAHDSFGEFMRDELEQCCEWRNR